MHPSVPPTISRSSVIGRVRKYKLSKTVKERPVPSRIFSEIEVFLVKEGPYTCMLYITFKTVKTGKT